MTLSHSSRPNNTKQSNAFRAQGRLPP